MESKNNEVDDNDIEASRGDIRKNVREILENLVAHFGQTIHAEVIRNSYSKDKTSVLLLSSTIDGSKKDQLEQQERELPPIVQLWLDRLLSLGGIVTIVCEWICGYEGIVRPRVFQAAGISSALPTFDERYIPVLKNYELVLSTLLLKSMSSSLSTFGSELSFAHPKKSLLRVINLLCTDVTLLTVTTTTRDETKDDGKNHFRRNEGIPALLQILGNTLEILRQMVSNDGQSTNQFTEFVSECYRSLRLCVVTILGFDVFRHGQDDSSFADSKQSAAFWPHIVSPLLSTSGACRRNNHLALLQRILEHTEISTSDHAPESITAKKCLETALGVNSPLYDDIDDDYWNSFLSTSFDSIFAAGWIDSNPVNSRGTLRLVQSIWHSMASLLLPLSKGVNNQPSDDKDDGMNIDVSGTKELRELRTFVLKKLGGPDPLLRDARAHFFGRNLHGMEDLAERISSNKADTMEVSSVVIKMGRRVTTTKTNTNADGSPIDGPINEKVPFRTVGAVNVLRLLLSQELIDDVDDACKENLLENIFPVCAALLDSNNTGFAVLGAAGFLRTFDLFLPREIDPTSTDFVPDELSFQKCDKIVYGVAFKNFAENTLAVLERSLQSNRDHGHLVVAIGRAQSRLFEIMLLEGRQSIESDDGLRRRRRIATEQWLSKLERSLYRPMTERQQLELLLGGVIPLLSQHAMDERSEADGMEVGRLGLAALLPITTNVATRVDIAKESSGVEQIARKTQMASLVGLMNLIFSAHPIMANHGGKIMSHLLMAAASATPSRRNENDSENETGELAENDPTMHSIRNMAILVAAIVLVVCQSKFAAELIESIEIGFGHYQQNLLGIVSEVRGVAAGLERYSN